MNGLAVAGLIALLVVHVMMIGSCAKQRSDCVDPRLILHREMRAYSLLLTYPNAASQFQPDPCSRIDDRFQSHAERHRLIMLLAEDEEAACANRPLSIADASYKATLSIAKDCLWRGAVTRGRRDDEIALCQRLLVDTMYGVPIELVLAEAESLGVNGSGIELLFSAFEEAPPRNRAIILHCVRRAFPVCRSETSDTETLRVARDWYRSERSNLVVNSAYSGINPDSTVGIGLWNL